MIAAAHDQQETPRLSDAVHSTIRLQNQIADLEARTANTKARLEKELNTYRALLDDHVRPNKPRSYTTIVAGYGRARVTIHNDVERGPYVTVGEVDQLPCLEESTWESDRGQVIPINPRRSLPPERDDENEEDISPRPRLEMDRTSGENRLAATASLDDF